MMFIELVVILLRMYAKMYVVVVRLTHSVSGHDVTTQARTAKRARSDGCGFLLLPSCCFGCRLWDGLLSFSFGCRLLLG